MPLSFNLTGSAPRNLPLTIDLTVLPGQRLALIGSNGCGKTSALRVVAGLDAAMPGSCVTLGPTTLNDDMTFRPAHKRRLPMVFAEPRLFPHYSVLENLTFGIKGGRRVGAETVARARSYLKAMGLEDLADRKAKTLSSGQGAMVSVLRATVAEPAGVLLDEPFSTLDAAIAARVRFGVHETLSRLTIPLVIATHSPLDVMTLATHVAVIENGVLVQHGEVDTVARRPTSVFAAKFLGLNLLRGEARDTTVATSGNSDSTRSNTSIQFHTAIPAEGEVWIAFPPQSVIISSERPTGSAQNCWQTKISTVEQLGSTIRIGCLDPLPIQIDVTPAAALSLHLHQGTPVWLSVKATGIEVYSS